VRRCFERDRLSRKQERHSLGGGKSAHGGDGLLIAGVALDTVLKMLPAATKRLLSALPPSHLKSKDFEDFFECLESYATLNEVSAIAAYNPTGLISVSPIRYLLFCLEAHHNEFYIFTERTKVWLTRLERCYRGHSCFGALRKSLVAAHAAIDAEARAFREIRSSHVHAKRYFDRNHPVRRMSLHSIAPDYIPPRRAEWKGTKVRELRAIRRRNQTAMRILKISSQSVVRILVRVDGTWIGA
jgi:hypothetical protein